MLTFKDYLIEKCNCWTGYKRKPGTKPCAEGSCVKEETQLDESAELAKQHGWEYKQHEYGASMTHPKHGRISISKPITTASGSHAVEREWSHNGASGIGHKSLEMHVKSLHGIKEETQLDEGLDPSEVAGNPKMYSAEVVKKAYYHKKASESDKQSLANHLDRHHGPKEWRKPVKESLADQILATAKAAGINAKIAPPLADRKKATMKLLKHRAREAKRNPPPPREMPPRKTGFGSGAEDDTKGT